MATKNYPYVKNLAATTQTTCFNVVWSWTRMMKKAGAKVMASSNGTTKDTTGAPEADKWNETSGLAGVGGITNAGGSGMTIAAAAEGRALVTGLSGLTSATPSNNDKGRFLIDETNSKAYQIEGIVSSTSCYIDARTVGVTAGSGLTWKIRDPQSATYPSGTLAAVTAWILLRAPGTVKIPITAAAVGLFVRGENVTQATTGAEGECLGVYWNGSTGHLCVMPRKRGSGANAFGWGTGNAVTGDVSGATVTQNGTAEEYFNEFVFWKHTDEINGSIFWGNFGSVTDSASTFTALASAAGCTATVAPGGGGTGNAFPANGAVIHGVSTTGTATNHKRWFASNDYSRAQMCAADMIPEEDYTADGSFAASLYLTSSTNGLSTLWAFHYCEDAENGDLCPFSFQKPYSGSPLYSSYPRTGQAEYGSSATAPATMALIRSASTTYAFFTGWRRRGLASNERWTHYEPINFAPAQTGGTDIMTTTPYTPMRPSYVEDASLQLHRVPLANMDASAAGTYNYKQLRGSPKWLRCAPGSASVYQVWQDADTPTNYFLQIAGGNAQGNGPLCIGPWPGDLDCTNY